MRQRHRHHRPADHKQVEGPCLLRAHPTATGPLRLYREGWGDYAIVLIDALGAAPRMLLETDDYAAALTRFDREARARAAA